MRSFEKSGKCDNGGAYLHSKTGNADKRDKNFQGFGRFLTARRAKYLFRTNQASPLPRGRAPHIHFAIKMKAKKELITQCYIQGPSR